MMLQVIYCKELTEWAMKKKETKTDQHLIDKLAICKREDVKQVIDKSRVSKECEVSIGAHQAPVLSAMLPL